MGNNNIVYGYNILGFFFFIRFFVLFEFHGSFGDLITGPLDPEFALCAQPL